MQGVQTSFIEEREKDPAVQAVEGICKDAAAECAKELIDMALGRIEIDKDRRLALMNVIEIAIGTKFRLRGRPAGEPSSLYKDLLKSVERSTTPPDSENQKGLAE